MEIEAEGQFHRKKTGAWQGKAGGGRAAADCAARSVCVAAGQGLWIAGLGREAEWRNATQRETFHALAAERRSVPPG